MVVLSKQGLAKLRSVSISLGPKVNAQGTAERALARRLAGPSPARASAPYLPRCLSKTRAISSNAFLLSGTFASRYQAPCGWASNTSSTDSTSAWCSLRCMRTVLLSRRSREPLKQHRGRKAAQVAIDRREQGVLEVVAIGTATACGCPYVGWR